MDIDPRKPPSIVRPTPPSDPSDTPEGGPRIGDVYLDWDQALDDRGHLRRCPVCRCPDLFVRKDFPQLTGFSLIVLAAVVSMILVGMEQLLAGLVVLALVVALDLAILLFSRKLLVCYRCRSEFRGLPIRPDQPGWELSVGEKYRPIGGETDSDPGT